MKANFQLLFICLTGLFIYGLWLGDSPLDRTEPFRALVAHQMVHGSSWLVPHLYGELYQRKPPLIYWIEASVEWIAGRGNESVWRLPSAVGSAFLAVFLAWWATRWFGPAARFSTGFACLALVALWDQNRSADIDALNTVAAILSTVCVLELICGFARWTAGWTIGLGIAFGATLLLKGPGGLPQLLGAVVGPAIFLRSWKRACRPAILVGVLIGSAIFTAYIVAAKLAMQHAGIAADKTGWYEVIEKMFLHGWSRRLAAFSVPFELLLYTLPVSAVLPFAVITIRQLPTEDIARQRAVAILGTLAAGLVIWTIDGNDNPRYEYVMLPLLAPLVGFVWVNWEYSRVSIYKTLLGVCVLLCAGNVVVTMKVHGAVTQRAVVLWGMIASVAVLVFTVGVVIRKCLRLRELTTKAASPVKDVLPSAVAILLVLFAVPMAARKNVERRRKSAMNPSVRLRQVIGNASRVSAAGVVRDLPELFYYANVDVDAYGEFGLPNLAATARGHWVVISENEKYPAYSTITKYIPRAFPRGVYKLPMADPRDVIYVGWYDPPADADTRIEWNVKKTLEPEE